MTAVRAIAIRVDVWHRALLLGNKKHPQTISVCERWITLARRCEAARLFVRVGSELSIERLASSGQSAARSCQTESDGSNLRTGWSRRSCARVVGIDGRRLCLNRPAMRTWARGRDCNRPVAPYARQYDGWVTVGAGPESVSKTSHRNTRSGAQISIRPPRTGVGAGVGASLFNVSGRRGTPRLVGGCGSC